jgi:hypothetical protein
LQRSHPGRRAGLVVLVGLVSATIAALAAGPTLGLADSGGGSTGATGTTAAASPPVSDDPNNYSCFGHVQKGAAEPGVTGTQVEYQFSCDGPITGYSIETEPHQISYFDQAPVVALKGVPSSLDGFSCNGFVPGLQVNCVGSASTAFEVITGQFVIADKNICSEPRVDPILNVAYAAGTATIGGTKAAPTATAVVTQYLSGPYDLGRPWGCKGDQYGSNTRLGSNPPQVVLRGRAKK